jgi:hypothetical protein
MGKFLDQVLGLAQGGTPGFTDVSFPVTPDASQRTDLLQRDPDTSVLSFSGDAQKELGEIPPLAQVQIRAHLSAAGDCIAAKDYRNCTKYLNEAKAVARRFDAKHLRQEIDNRLQEVADCANGTHTADFAERHTDGESEQNSPGMDQMQQQNMLSRPVRGDDGEIRLAHAYERFEHGREEHVSEYMGRLKHMVSGATTGMLSPPHYGLLEAARKEMYVGGSHDMGAHNPAQGVVGGHLEAAAKAAREDDAEGVHTHLMAGAQAAHEAGMHGAAAELSQHLTDLHNAHAYDEKYGTGMPEAKPGHMFVYNASTGKSDEVPHAEAFAGMMRSIARTYRPGEPARAVAEKQVFDLMRQHGYEPGGKKVKATVEGSDLDKVIGLARERPFEGDLAALAGHPDALEGFNRAVSGMASAAEQSYGGNPRGYGGFGRQHMPGGMTKGYERFEHGREQHVGPYESLRDHVMAEHWSVSGKSDDLARDHRRSHAEGEVAHGHSPEERARFGMDRVESEDVPHFIGGSTIREDRIRDRNEE